MRILVIEDEKKIADSIKKGLVQETMAVDVAYDGEEGLELALSEKYDVIVLDLMLPFIDGLEVCRRLRSEDIQTPILILTARGEVADKVKGLNIGADDYLAKPFDFDELVARINALNRRPRTAVNSILKVDDITLDNTNLIVKKGKSSINLSKKEFALLKYLMINKNRILTKESIISNVWDFESDTLPNTVEVYIGYLRKKVGIKYFKTVRGFGYKMIEN